ncbi:hypothetical protein P4233_10175 [Pseudomonas aeruginosa]|nr:hypothetical protein [Pseudomonas aeruginosa]
MGTWISDIPLKYKFWAVNAVAFFTTLLLVLFAMQQEAAGRNASAQRAAAAEGELVQSWPAGGTPARPQQPAAAGTGREPGRHRCPGAGQGKVGSSCPARARAIPAARRLGRPDRLRPAPPCSPRPATCGRSSPTVPAPTPSPCWC